MLNNSYFCALDIGSSSICACVATIKRRQVQSIFLETIPSRGIVSGSITDSIALTDCVSRLLKNLKAKSALKIKSAALNISGHDISARHSRAIIPLAERGNKVITRSDLSEANEQARILGSSLDEEILHTIPCGYTIDFKNNIINPIGLYSHRLEADLYLVLGKLSSIQSLNRMAHQAGIDVSKIYFSGWACSKAVQGRSGLPGSQVLCDIGSDITEILFFKDGLLKDICIFSAGGDDITGALQEGLKVNRELAEDLKRSYGLIASSESIPEDKEILVKKSNFYNPIKHRAVVDIVSASSRELCRKIKGEIAKRASNYEIDSVTACGRTILLEGFIEILENTLSIEVKMARIENERILDFVKTSPELAPPRHLAYLPCLGMLCDSLEKEVFGLMPLANPAKSILAKAAMRFKEVYQEYF